MSDESITEPWTIETVKRDLPQVQVRFGKAKPIYARVSGRLNPFATVSVDIEPIVNHTCFADFQFAWGTIVNALNSGKVLILQS